MSYYTDLIQADIHSWLRNLKGYIRRMGDGRYVAAIEKMGTDHFWVYTNCNQMARCDIYQKVFFEKFGIISSRCRDCWKVCVRPETVKGLFDLYDLQRDLGLPSKCGLNDTRPYVFGNYGGYWYTKSKKEGLTVKSMVLSGLHLHTILKRYCTEFEHKLGPSDKLEELTEEDLKFEEYILDLFPIGEKLGDQPADLIAHMKRKWIECAYSIGDDTYLEFTDGVPLYSECVTYE